MDRQIPEVQGIRRTGWAALDRDPQEDTIEFHCPHCGAEGQKKARRERTEYRFTDGFMHMREYWAGTPTKPNHAVEFPKGVTDICLKGEQQKPDPFHQRSPALTGRKMSTSAWPITAIAMTQSATLTRK